MAVFAQSRIFTTKNNNPFLNIATETWLFKERDIRFFPTLFLWRNSPTVVIGKHQNPFKECNLNQMENQVFLTRRHSGGGAVYQDLGNTNFTFLSEKKKFSKESNNQIILDALSTFGIKAELSGRNDIVVEGRKISGAAFNFLNDRAIHHGTLMLNVDLSALKKYLTPSLEKLKSKGVASVESRVLNLREVSPTISHETVSKAIINAFCCHHQLKEEPIELDENHLMHQEGIVTIRRHLEDWDWRFGNTPDFDHRMETRFNWGIMDVLVKSQRGLIQTVKIFSDTLFPQMIELLEESFRGVPYNKKGIEGAIKKVHENNEQADFAPFLLEFKQWMVEQVPN